MARQMNLRPAADVKSVNRCHHGSEGHVRQQHWVEEPDRRRACVVQRRNGIVRPLRRSGRIRRCYVTGSEPGSRTFATFLMVSRLKGFTMMLKDPNLNLPEGRPVETTLKLGSEPF